MELVKVTELVVLRLSNCNNLKLIIIIITRLNELELNEEQELEFKHFSR
jgi:hypothetical protein